MSKSDDVDAARARRFAWKLPTDDQAAALIEQGDDEDDDGLPSLEEMAAAESEGAEPSPELKKLREEAAEACGKLAVEIDRVWVIPSPPEQAEATGRLVRKVAALGLPAVALNAYPLQSVRLARLAVRHFDRMPRGAREAAGHACLWLDYDHPDLVELVVEVASAGNQRIATPMWLALGDEEAQLAKRWPDLPRRLAALLDQAPSPRSQVMALDWLEVAPARDAVPALRRALRRPHFGARSRALRVLLKLSALTADDVVFLVEDLVPHPPPMDSGGDWEEGMQYAKTMIEAVAALRPAASIEPLKQLIAGDCAYPDGFRDWLDEGWALRALAAGFPGEAIPIVDDWLRHRRSAERLEAVEAAAKLPLDDARPRLLRGAGDPAGAVCSRARDLWIEVVGSPCPEGDLAGFPIEQLPGPPSERFASRLQILRGPSEEGREAMLEVLLGEAPDAEALALLGFALGDDSLWMPRHRKRLPRDMHAWARRLLERFGEPAVAVIAALERRYVSEHEYQSWLSGVSDFLRDRRPSAEIRAAVRVLAERMFLAGETGVCTLRLLERVGPLPGLLDRLWAMGFGADDSYQALRARDVLRSWPRGGPLDERLGAALDEAWAARDKDRLATLLYFGLHRKHRRALELAERVLAEFDREQGSGLFTLCVNGLIAARRIDQQAWLREAVQDPDGKFFPTASWLGRTGMRPAVRDGLRRALKSEARGGRAAAEAAEALMVAGKLPAAGPTVKALLKKAPPDARAHLLMTAWSLRRKRPPVAELGEDFIELLTSPDPKVVKALEHYIGTFHTPREQELLRRALPRVASVELREEIEEALETDGDGYWEDG